MPTDERTRRRRRAPPPPDVILFAGLAGAAGLAALALGPRASRPVTTTLALAGLLGLAAVVATLPTGFEAFVGDVAVRPTAYARLWVIATCLATAALVVLASAARVVPSAAPVGVLVVVLCAAALFAPGGAAAILLATGAGIAAAALAGSQSLRPRVDAIRAAAAAGLIGTSGAALATGPAQTEAVALTLGGAGIVVATALRLGVAPLHRSAVRVSDATPLAFAPLVVAFAPAAFVVAAHSLFAVATPSPEAGWLAIGIRAAAVAGVALAAAGLLLQTGLEHALPYAFAAEAAFVLLALAAASDPAVAAALRTRLLVMPLAAAAAWSAVAALRLDPSWARDGLRGWARRAPALALTLVAAALALFGWPGSPAWEARQTIAAAAFGPVPGAVALVASATPTVSALVRALVVGSRAPERRPEYGPRVRQARRRDTWRMPLGAICALALAVLAIAVSAGAGDVAGAAAGSVAVR